MILRLADWLVYGLMGLDSSAAVGRAVHFFVYDSVKILLLLFFISVVEIHIELEAIMIDINKAVSYVENMANMRLCDCDHAGGDGN